jgi:hypothetical protein
MAKISPEKYLCTLGRKRTRSETTGAYSKLATRIIKSIQLISMILFVNFKTELEFQIESFNSEY